MKKTILAACLFYSCFSKAQTITTYYDWQWRACEAGQARFAGVVNYTDSGWYRTDYFISTKRLQMEGLFKDSACKVKNGSFTYYYANGNLSSIVRYVDNKAEGLRLDFYNNGMMSDSTVYENGSPVGTSVSWHNNGYILDSTVYNNTGAGISFAWFDDGTPSIAGRIFNDKKQGKWQYFHKNGQLASMEEYRQGALVNKTLYDESGKLLTDTASKDRDAAFKGGNNAWENFLLRNLNFPSNYNIVNTDIITVVIAALVDEDGNIKDAYVQIPFNKVFDDEALRVIKRSPKWSPCIKHNRRVRMYIRQPVSFAQTD